MMPPYPLFSIIIPTWNNLQYLKSCIESIEKNSVFEHQIILHVNEGNDGTLEWVRKNGILHTYSSENVGICIAVNTAFSLNCADYVVYMNDDMYVCPDWDKYLWDEITKLNTNCFLFSSTMIEPNDSNNQSVIIADYGKTVDSFKEEELLANLNKLTKHDWFGSSWPPVIIHKTYWKKIGGFSEEFTPGMYSDPDLSMKMWQQGCRIFKGVGKSKVYHFQEKSTGKVKKNDGRKQFLKKWKLLPSTYYKYYLKMGKDYTGILNDPSKNDLALRINILKAKLLILIIKC